MIIFSQRRLNLLLPSTASYNETHHTDEERRAISRSSGERARGVLCNKRTGDRSVRGGRIRIPDEGGGEWNGGVPPGGGWIPADYHPRASGSVVGRWCFCALISLIRMAMASTLFDTPLEYNICMVNDTVEWFCIRY